MNGKEGSCRVLRTVCNNSHDVEAVGLSLLPVELAIDANLGWELAHGFLTLGFALVI